MLLEADGGAAGKAAESFLNPVWGRKQRFRLHLSRDRFHVGPWTSGLSRDSTAGMVHHPNAIVQKAEGDPELQTL